MDDEERMLRIRAKALMRKRFRSQRGSIPKGAVAERSRLLCERLLGNEALAKARRVALFWPIVAKNEVDLRSVDAALRERDATLAYPAIDAERVMRFHVVSDRAQLTPCELGFMAPPLDAPVAEELDVVIVPGIAFDPKGYRIGYGGGFYDQALPTVCPPALAIGVAFDFQLAADVPYDDTHDVPVDVIVTDQRVLPATR